MNWRPDRNRPIGEQICEHVCTQIASGAWQPHTRLMSVRDTAAAMGVNPNTVQHTFTLLEQQGVLYSVHNTGWYVGEDITVAKERVRQLARDKTAAFFAEMSNLGLSAEAVKHYVEEWRYE